REGCRARVESRCQRGKGRTRPGRGEAHHVERARLYRAGALCGAGDGTIGGRALLARDEGVGERLERCHGGRVARHLGEGGGGRGLQELSARDLECFWPAPAHERPWAVHEGVCARASGHGTIAAELAMLSVARRRGCIHVPYRLPASQARIAKTAIWRATLWY